MNTITVTTTADSGKGSLRAAIDNARSGDTIRFAKKLKNKTIKLTSGQLYINKNLVIDGAIGGARSAGITVSGNRKSRVFFVDKKRKVTFKNLAITNGKTLGAGGGIDARHYSDITLINVSVRNNLSEQGGGVRVGHMAKGTFIDSEFINNDGTLTDRLAGFSSGAIVHNESRGQIVVKRTRFEGNKGFNGGAIYSLGSVTFNVEDSVFLNNTSTNRLGGGAIMTDGVSAKNYSAGLAGEGKIVIRGSQFKGNVADGVGGALFLYGYRQDRAIIEDTIIEENRVNKNGGRGQGGGLWVKMQLDMRNVTLANNIAEKQGGGLWLETKFPINIVNSTVSGNQALDDAGGGLFLKNKTIPINITNSTIAYNKAGRAAGGLWFDRKQKVYLKNSIVASNTAGKDRRQDQVAFQPIDRGGNLEFALSPKAQRVTNKTLVANPLLNTLRRVDGALIHTLRAGSPAVDAGVSQGAPKTDQRGIVRDRKIDIGAFELGRVQPIPEPPSPPEFSTAVAHLSFEQTSGSVIKDVSTSGLNNLGRLIGKPSWTKGIKGNAIKLDGNLNAIKLNNSTDINIAPTAAEKTISLWFKADSLNQGKQVLYEQGGLGRGLNIYLDQDRLYVGGWNLSAKQSGWKGNWLSTKVTANQWHHVDLVLDGGAQITQNSLRGYLDGKNFGSSRGSQLWKHADGIGIGNTHGQTRFHDGITPDSSAFGGLIDEVTIFNKALNHSELGALM